jgi:hypothetical protein
VLRAWTFCGAVAAAVTLSGCSAPAVVPPTPPVTAEPTTAPDAASADPVAGSFAPTPSPSPLSYAELGEFGRWARTIDELYGLEPDFQDWNDAAEANCDLQREGDTESVYVPDAAVALAEDPSGSMRPIGGRIWAAAVLTRCPDLLNTPPVRTQVDQKLAGLDWVEPDWVQRIPSA